MSHIGVGPSNKEEKFPLFEKFPTYRGGRGGDGEIGMVSQVLPVLNYDSFPTRHRHPLCEELGVALITTLKP